MIYISMAYISYAPVPTLGGAAAAWPLAAREQQVGKLPTIGFLGGGARTSQRAWVEAFARRLREPGWTEGRTVAIEYRWAEGNGNRLAEIAAEFVRLKVDLIYAVGTESALAAKQATSVIPIVFPVTGDPVGTGLVASLARPGGNVTGLSNLAVDLAAKRHDILREVFPGLTRFGDHGQRRLFRRSAGIGRDTNGSAHPQWSDKVRRNLAHGVSTTVTLHSDARKSPTAFITVDKPF
jgi:hypothetical protein